MSNTGEEKRATLCKIYSSSEASKFVILKRPVNPEENK